MFLLQGGIFMVLAGMLYQDLKYRGIYWWMFPILLLLLAIGTVQILGFSEMIAQVVKSCLFLGLQFLALTAYISIRQKKLTNVFNGFFGLGDLLFLLAISFGFSFLNYVLFYLLSLMMVVLFTAIFGHHTQAHGKKIPLAGYQALLLMILMAVSWYKPVINLLSDENLINLLSYGS
ncbi:hypothetical protein SRABI27_04854 [Pedobacter sp. Bi27]|uniref:hypothetical protein n=1 Tax=unclassified Pedobacter TaxID=2628915 RepID=UPI001D8C8B07|nr:MULTISPECIES: hypothetical protein [unclassified Pedobacter]CAH0304069.1 hypothetical protein SRABI36_04745 [Pedobacter sp. Bi36]CAH0312700.1 hypothetical protein SRABI27_04854 [Pedobacter sp. Bi27]CAH0313265.1 hypothetical protein SRABI126_04869 [Pedobacter sp. Bi126]